MKKIYFYFSLIVPLIILVSCSTNKKHLEQYYDNKALKEIILTNELSGGKIEYKFYPNGNLQKITRYDSAGILEGEQVWFFESGIIDRKVPIHKGKALGNAYYYYDTTGALSSDRYFRNDIPVFYGADYWGDSMNAIKSSLHFNNNGGIFYKKNFDKNGGFVSEEGRK